MGETSMPLLEPYSVQYGGNLSSFLETNLEAGYIGLQNASRLISRLPLDADPQLAVVSRDLQNVTRRDLATDREVIAAALRTGADFDPGQAVVTQSIEGSRGTTGEIASVDGEAVTVRINKLVSLELTSFYPGLFTTIDNDILESHPHGRGKPSLAHYIIKLSFFDPRMASFPEIINRAGRKYHAGYDKLRKV